MKLKNTSRILAIALALVMIVPVISIPALAEDATTMTPNHIVDPLDFEGNTVGAHAGSPAEQSYPIGATYANFDGDMAVKFDMMIPSLTDVTYTYTSAGNTYYYSYEEYYNLYVNDYVTGDFIVLDRSGGVGFNCIYFLTAVTDKTFDADKFANGTDDEKAAEAAKLVFVDSTITTGKGLYIGRNGDTAYLYMYTAINTQVTDDADKVNVTPLATYHTREIFNKYLSDGTTINHAAIAQYAALIGNRYNANKQWKPLSDALTYNSEEGANNTYVYSADYYVPSGTQGSAKFILQNKELCTMNFTAGTFYNSKTALPKDEWFNVKIYLTLTGDTTSTAVIYLNDTEIASVNITAAIAANAWCVARIEQNFTTDYNKGSFYIDNVCAYEYEEGNTYYAYDANGDYVYYVNGQSYTEDLYTAETVIKVPTVTHEAVSALALTTADKSSIRCGTDSTSSGLRFLTTVNTAAIESLLEGIGSNVTEIESITYGTLIAPTDLLGGEELVLGFGGGENVSYINVITTTGRFYNEGESVNQFTGSIVNIYESNMTREFTGRGYCKIELASGDELVIYSASSKSISVAAQAEATLAAYENNEITLADVQLEQVKAFAAYAG